MKSRGYERLSVVTSSCAGCKTPLNPGFDFCLRCLGRIPAEIKQRMVAARPGSDAQLIATREAEDHLTAGGGRRKARSV